MRPNQEKFLKRILKILLIALVVWFVIKHIIFFLILVGLIVALGFILVKWAPEIFEFFDNIKDFFSK